MQSFMKLSLAQCSLTNLTSSIMLYFLPFFHTLLCLHPIMTIKYRPSNIFKDPSILGISKKVKSSLEFIMEIVVDMKHFV